MESRKELKPIPYDSICLAAVIHELQPLIGARVQKVRLKKDLTLVLSLYRGSERDLLISAEPESARMYLLSRSIEKTTGPFLESVRSHLKGAKLISAIQVGLDRIAELRFTTSGGVFVLIVELMGKHSNIILCRDDGRIIDAIKSVSQKQSQRPIQRGRLYEPPPLPPRPSFFQAEPGDKLRDFEGVSPFLTQLIDSGLNLEEVQSRVQKQAFEAWFLQGVGAYPLPLNDLSSEAVKRDSISQALEQHFEERVAHLTIEQARSTLLGQLQRVLNSRKDSQDHLESAIKSAAKAPLWQLYGELILAYQGSIKHGATTLDAFDYEGNPLSVPLDPEKSAVENSHKYFQKSKKAKEKQEEVTNRLGEISAQIEQLESAIAELLETDSLDRIADLKEEAKRKRWLQKEHQGLKKEERPYQGFSIREATSPAGWLVLYGTNATSNDYLTTRVANSNDYWLHVRGQTSAHVVLKTLGQPEKVQKVDIEFAAKIAAKFSVAKHSTHVPVDYTLKKFVRKPKKSAPGFATYTGEKTVHVDP